MNFDKLSAHIWLHSKEPGELVAKHREAMTETYVMMTFLIAAMEMAGGDDSAEYRGPLNSYRHVTDVLSFFLQQATIQMDDHAEMVERVREITKNVASSYAASISGGDGELSPEALEMMGQELTDVISNLLSDDDRGPLSTRNSEQVSKDLDRMIELLDNPLNQQFKSKYH